jgi:hypothetical protein
LNNLAYGFNSGMNKSDFFMENGSFYLTTYFNKDNSSYNETYRRVRRTFLNNVDFNKNIEKALYSIMVIQKVPGPSPQLE